MSGAATYVEQLAQELSQYRQHEFIWYIGPDREPAFRQPPSHFRVVVTPAAYFSPLRRLFWDQVVLRRIVKRERPDLLYSTGNFALLGSPAKQLLLVTQPVPFSALWLETVYPTKSLASRIGWRLRRGLICLSARMADVVMTPTQAMLDDLQRFTEVDLHKTLVNPFGVAAPAGTEEDARSRATARRPRDPARIRLLYISLYAEHKNLGTLLRAIPLLNSPHPGKFLLTTTVDPAWDGAAWTVTHKEDLALARRPEVAPWVRFLGPLNPQQVQELYRESDVFVFPSLAESFGFPMPEAMAHGLPIVAADTPANREICGDAARYFKPLSADDLAQKLESLVEDQALMAKLGTAGRERVATRFRWDGHVERFLRTLADAGSRGLGCV